VEVDFQAREYQSKRARAMILLASSTGMSAPQIAELMRTDESHVRKVIHAFNGEGFGSLDPDYRGGRPKKTTPEQRDRIVAVARARPDTLGVALTRWSLAKSPTTWPRSTSMTRLPPAATSSREDASRLTRTAGRAPTPCCREALVGTSPRAAGRLPGLGRSCAGGWETGEIPDPGGTESTGHFPSTS
jgi:transposase